MISKTQATLEVSPDELPHDAVTHSLWNLWNKSTIASLTAIQISRMNSETLVEVVELVRPDLPQAIVRSRLELCDRPTLERLTYLGRRICRNQGY
jgi:hypothetical protein